MNNNFNLIIAIVLALGIMFGWQYFYEKPRIEALAKQHQNYNKTLTEAKIDSKLNIEEPLIDREILVSDINERVKILTPHLGGSISKKGLRFDDIILLDYKKDINDNSKGVELLSPSNSKESYFVEIGLFNSNDKNNSLPDQNTVWKASDNVLEVGKPIYFTWQNKENVKFIVKVTIDENYMFFIEQKIVNNSEKIFSAQSYAIINRVLSKTESSNTILHEGPIGVFNGNLEDSSYESIKDKKNKNYVLGKVSWLGITDKYWLTAFIPDQNFNYISNFSYGIKYGLDNYQVDVLSEYITIGPGKEFLINNMLFTGAKKVNLLDEDSKKYNIKLFDRAIDFGIFYIITKPLFHFLNFFYEIFGNFGISIIMVTIIIKLALFGIANKSYRSIKKIKLIQPKIERLKDLYGNDKVKLNQEIMELYKQEKVNPLSGCLPLFIQIPVFFSIYKVLYVTIEMRHAPFYGWIKDLSGPDPTNIFNLFGILNFTPPQYLAVGAWPILMAFTMYLQQRMSPEPADPMQANMMKFMPLIFLVMFAKFPAGLLIYWTWNNILSIIQQYYINKMG